MPSFLPNETEEYRINWHYEDIQMEEEKSAWDLWTQPKWSLLFQDFWGFMVLFLLFLNCVENAIFPHWKWVWQSFRNEKNICTELVCSLFVNKMLNINQWNRTACMEIFLNMHPHTDFYLQQSKSFSLTLIPSFFPSLAECMDGVKADEKSDKSPFNWISGAGH